MQTEVRQINRILHDLHQPQSAWRRGVDLRSQAFRQELATSARAIAMLIDSKRQLAIQDWNSRIMNDSAAGPYGTPDAPGVSLSTDLQRQLILSTAIRAFRRRLVAANVFAHTYQTVALQGGDTVVVPYFPLMTAGSQRFVAGIGYQFSGADVAESRSIPVGGQGPAVKIPGQDRAYQTLSLSSYLLSRQPWVDVEKLIVMRAEQLALDVWTDIVTAWILKANFGNAVWSGLPAAFNSGAVALIAGVAKKLNWPANSRNLVIGTDYWLALVQDPNIKAVATLNSEGQISEGRLNAVYGFDQTVESPNIPVTSDGNLVGFASFPSAVLIAIAPITPTPGEAKNLLSWEQAVDLESGISLVHKRWGEPWNSTDREVLECAYGSELGELKALLRLAANGL